MICLGKASDVPETIQAAPLRGLPTDILGSAFDQHDRESPLRTLGYVAFLKPETRIDSPLGRGNEETVSEQGRSTTAHSKMPGEGDEVNDAAYLTMRSAKSGGFTFLSIRPRYRYHSFSGLRIGYRLSGVPP